MYIDYSNSMSTLAYSSRRALRLVSTNILHRSSSSSAYCVELVKKHDYENFLCSLLLSKKIRDISFVVRAFNAELSLIRDLVSNPNLGLMRINFWKDAIDKIYKGKPPNHPVALELNIATSKAHLSKAWLKRLVDIREKSLYDKPFTSLQDLEEYAENSVSPIYYLLLEALELKNIHIDHAASHLGKAQGLTNHLRGIHFNASKGRVTVPTELLAKFKISQEDILRKNIDQRILDLSFEIASKAHEHLELALSLLNENDTELRRKWKENDPDLPLFPRIRAPESFLSIFLPSVSCREYLKDLEKRNFDVFHPSINQRRTMLPLKLFYFKFKDSYS